MTGLSEAHSSGFPKVEPLALREGVISGIIGAVGIAIWFLISDSIQGRPFYTPSVLGTVLLNLLKGGAGLSAVESVPVSLGMVFMFSIIHGTLFLGIGLLCAWLLHLAENDVIYFFNVLLLLIFFACGLTFSNMMLAGVVINALSVIDILIAHILAVAAMGCYYWKRHPNIMAQL